MDEEQIVSKVKASITPYQTEISIRNNYIAERDGYIYGDDLIGRIDLTDAMDITRYNWLARAVDIHTVGLMGRSFQVFSTYDKKDLSIAKDIGDEQQLKTDHLLNKTLKSNADARRDLVASIIRENGDDDTFLGASEQASAYGFVVFKSWPDLENKAWRYEALENPENFVALWSDQNFRQRDADVYVHQISPLSANQLYGQYLEDGETFSLSQAIDTLSPIAQPAEKGEKTLVTVMEYTGYLAGIGGSRTLSKKQKDAYDGEGADSKFPEPEDYLIEVDPGEETRINLLIVGDKLVRVMTKEEELPKYYIIHNKKRPKRPWGVSDISKEAIDINITFLERMSNWNTIIDRVGFPKYIGKGFDGTNLPHPRPRVVEVLPVSETQDIALLGAPNYAADFAQVIDKLEVEFVRSVSISRVLFDDPSLAANSNQALTTLMKGMTDTVERKQKIWQSQLRDMFEDMLRTAGKLWKEVGDLMDEDDNWHLSIKWPSVLRKDDSVYLQNLINRYNTGSMSLDTLLEEFGVDNVGEEIDRIRDNYQDPLIAAIMSRQTALIAQQLLQPPAPEGPKTPDIKVSLRGDLTPNQEANLAAQNGFLEGPYPASAGPQGNEGNASNTNVTNTGYIEGDQNKAGFGLQVAPDGSPAASTPAAPQTTPDANQPGTGIMSQPGSGATPVSAEGANAMVNQNKGA